MPRLVTRHPGNRDHAISWHISTFHTCPMQLHAMGNICNFTRKHVVVAQINPYTASHITTKIVTTQYRLIPGIPYHFRSYSISTHHPEMRWFVFCHVLRCCVLRIRISASTSFFICLLWMSTAILRAPVKADVASWSALLFSSTMASAFMGLMGLYRWKLRILKRLNQGQNLCGKCLATRTYGFPTCLAVDAMPE